MANTNLKIHFLGTGTSQGVPPIGCMHPVCLSNNHKDKRLRSSVLLEKNGKCLVIDSGPDFRQQMLRENVTHIESILYTHEHNDHVLGLDDIRPLVFASKKDMPLFGLERVLNELKNRFPYIFAEHKYPGIPSVELNPIVPFEAFDLEGFHILPIAVSHGGLPILGYIIDEKFAYITDGSELEEKTLEALIGIEVLVINALRKEQKHFSHFLLDEAIQISEKVEAKSAYFTHISHMLGFHNEVENELPENFHLAYDGLIIEFN